MAIKIEIEAASAAEMHTELKSLLFGAPRPHQVTSDNWSEEYQGQVGEERKAEPIDKSSAAADPEPVKETPKKKRRSKAETETGKAAEVETAVEAVPEIHEEPEEVLNPAPAKETKVKKYSLDDTRQLIITKGSSKKAKIAAILGKHGVQTLPQLSEDQLQEVYVEIEAL